MNPHLVEQRFLGDEDNEELVEMPELKVGQIGIIQKSNNQGGRIIMGLYCDGDRRSGSRPHSVELASGHTWSGPTTLKVKLLTQNEKLIMTLHAGEPRE